MRIYTNCKDCVREVERELYEMGIEVKGDSMQDKVVTGNEDYYTKELSPYMFQVTKPTGDHEAFIKYLFPDDYIAMKLWADHEFAERISDKYINPGEAWTLRGEVWGEFLHNNKFYYTYNNRIRPQLQRIIQELIEKPSTRQAIIEIHNNHIDINNLGGAARIPCSLYYQLLIREGKLDMIYVMRSCDYLTHFPFDNYLAILLQAYIALRVKVPVGRYTYMTGSLHSYNKDMKTRGIF